MSKHIIEIENIGKRYRIGGQKEAYLSLRDEIVSLLSPARRRERAAKEVFWALRDVSFSVEQGEAIGIIGRNGAGKSTLLKVLSQITPPTEGRITLHGRIASLLEVGTGFHPELTGRENVYLNGAILGMTRKEIASKFDEIVDFAEVEKFLDTPVKRYSSGMYVRLAFAVAAHLEPEILVVDEVLAVGDGAFQKKCLGKMNDVAHSGRTVLFVSHNMAAVEGLCTRGIVLSKGTTAFYGGVSEAIEYYQNSAYAALKSGNLESNQNRTGDGALRIVDVRIGTNENPNAGVWVCGKPGIIDIDYVMNRSEPLRNVDSAVIISSLGGSRLLYLGSKVLRKDFGDISRGGTFRCYVNEVSLEPGHYSITTELRHLLGAADRIDDSVLLEVTNGDYFGTGAMWPGSCFLTRYDWQNCESSKLLNDGKDGQAISSITD